MAVDDWGLTASVMSGQGRVSVLSTAPVIENCREAHVKTSSDSLRLEQLLR